MLRVSLLPATLAVRSMHPAPPAVAAPAPGRLSHKASVGGCDPPQAVLGISQIRTVPIDTRPVATLSEATFPLKCDAAAPLVAPIVCGLKRPDRLMLCGIGRPGAADPDGVWAGV